MTTTPTTASPIPDGALIPYAARRAITAPELTFTERQEAIIRTLIAPDVNNDEMALFLEVCRSTGLNPLMRQVYAIVRNKDDEKKRAMTIQTGIDGYRLLAARTGALAGIDDPVYDTEDGKHPNRATVTVYRLISGQRVPFTATARWREYAALTKDGQPVAMWAKMPWLMLGKCSEALALRRAFPAELSGVYTGEEMAQADNPPLPYVESEPTRPQTPARPPAPAASAKRPAPAPVAPAAPWKAMTDADVLQQLNHLDIRGRAQVQAFLGTVKAEMEGMGLAWTRDQVLAHLREVYDEEAASGEVGEQWTVTPAGDNDPAPDDPDENDLAALATGAPGN